MICIDPSYFLFFWRGGGGCLVGYCMMIETALSYYLNKHHGRNDSVRACGAEGQFKAFK